MFHMPFPKIVLYNIFVINRYLNISYKRVLLSIIGLLCGKSKSALLDLAKWWHVVCGAV